MRTVELRSLVGSHSVHRDQQLSTDISSTRPQYQYGHNLVGKGLGKAKNSFQAALARLMFGETELSPSVSDDRGVGPA